MSENERDEIDTGGAAKSAADGPAATGAAANDREAASTGRLTELMADDPLAAASRARPDLDADALRAAQEAIAEGERALAQARAQLASERPPAPAPAARRRELALRLLLAANVIAMLVVVMLPFGTPAPAGGDAPVATGAPTAAPPATGAQPPAPPRLAPSYEQALQAAIAGDHAGALKLLGEYLEQSPNMAPSQRINVYHQMAHYASILGQFATAEEYERKAQTLSQSHKLPDDLVASAKAALASGDQEGLRQIWARFLLQQRQIPSSLYQHVAEAYLQLGDSYRLQANAAAEQERLEELRKTEALLREQAAAEERGR